MRPQPDASDASTEAVSQPARRRADAAQARVDDARRRAAAAREAADRATTAYARSSHLRVADLHTELALLQERDARDPDTAADEPEPE